MFRLIGSPIFYRNGSPENDALLKKESPFPDKNVEVKHLKT